MIAVVDLEMQMKIDRLGDWQMWCGDWQTGWLTGDYHMRLINVDKHWSVSATCLEVLVQC